MIRIRQCWKVTADGSDSFHETIFKQPFLFSWPNTECVQSGPQSLTYFVKWVSKCTLWVDIFSSYNSGRNEQKATSICWAASIWLVVIVALNKMCIAETNSA